MVGITHKSNSLRKAVARAIVRASSQQTIDAVLLKKVPKGDVYEFSRAAGLLAIKKTSDTIPDCHPIPVEYASITHTIEGLEIIIQVEVHTIYKTGVEVEAMHGAAVTALTIYDMLKPIDKELEITGIRLLNKKGGKSDFAEQVTEDILCAVVVCSDGVSSGNRQDSSGKAIVAKLREYGLEVQGYEVIPDDLETIQKKARQLSEEAYQLVLFTGGTGLSPRDVTPEAVSPLIERQIPGIMEAARQYGQQRTPYAMLSRGVAGFIKKTLVMTLPGSPRGAVESMEAVFPYILHVFRVAAGMKHAEDLKHNG
jgi:molybdenum cofactor biosynthesis protein MoaC